MAVLQDFYSAMSDDAYSNFGDGPFLADCPLTAVEDNSHSFSDIISSRVTRMVIILVGFSYTLSALDAISFPSFLVLSISVLFTWSHIWLALKMCFYPLEFWGFKCFGYSFGWQGIVPGKAHKMASKSCDLMIDKLIVVKDIIDRISGFELVSHLRDIGALEKLEKRISDRLRRSNRFFRIFQDQSFLVDLVSSISDSVCLRFVDELKVLLKDPTFFDLRKLIVSEFVSNKKLLVHLFTQVGCRELEFIQLAGAVMGLLCGLFQLLLFSKYYNYIGAFVASGLLIGLVTNWLALYMIFNPVDPIHIVFTARYKWVFHGMFLRRQAEASFVYSSIVTEALLNVDRSIGFLKTEGKWSTVVILFNKILEDEVYSELPAIVPVRWKQSLLNEIRAEITNDPLMLPIVSFISDRLALRDTIRVKLATLPSDQFEQMLHPVFQEDEWLLILMGAVLGAAVGVLQAFMI